jgi:hypothetical protein
MATPLIFTLSSINHADVADSAGSSEYVTAVAIQQNGPLQGILTATKRQTTSPLPLPGVTLIATLMFNKTPGIVSNLTLQGVADLETKNEAGSVSAASDDFADQIGGGFSFDAATLTLTITPVPRVPAFGASPSTERPAGRLAI